MFKIVRFSHLCLASILLCTILLAASAINLSFPAATAATSTCVNVPIVMYHHVSDKNNKSQYVISPKTLRKDFQYFSDNGITPISFRQLREYTEKGSPLPPKPIIITFDDGNRSFLTKVVPLLEEFGFPANVNIIGALTELYTENGDTNDSYAYLNKEDIKSLSQNPLIETGCHTYNLHTLGTRRGMAKLNNETEQQYISVIKSDIEKFNKLYYEITGEKLTVFAYPFGIKNNLIPEILKENGYKIILTSGERINKISTGSSLTELGRFNRPDDISSENFFRKLFPIAKDSTSVYN